MQDNNQWQSQERREFVRADFLCKLTISDSSQEFNLHTENIGAGGIRVFISEQLEVSSIVQLQLCINEYKIVCQGRIVWVVEQPDALFDTGIEFYQIKEEDRKVIATLVETLMSGS